MHVFACRLGGRGRGGGGGGGLTITLTHFALYLGLCSSASACHDGLVSCTRPCHGLDHAALAQQRSLCPAEAPAPSAAAAALAMPARKRAPEPAPSATVGPSSHTEPRAAVPGEDQPAQMRLEHQQRLDALRSQLQAEEQAVKQAAEQEAGWGSTALDCWQRVQLCTVCWQIGSVQCADAATGRRRDEGAACPAGSGTHWLLCPLHWRCKTHT